MRHNNARRKLGRTTSHRLALFRNQLASLVQSERIVTTLPKAKELRPLAERMITQGKKDTVHARRLVGRWVSDRRLIQKLFEEIAPRFASRPGGYLRIVKLGSRQGDGAELAVLEFVDFTRKESKGGADGKSKKAKKQAADAEESAAEAPEAEKKPAEKKPAAKKARVAAPKAKKAEPKAKTSRKAPSTAKRTSAPKKIGGS